MTFFRNKMFLEGIALGGICGIVIGSIIAFAIEESNVGLLRRFVNQRTTSKRGVDYKYLY
jgi:hypothetical protein